VKIAVYMLILCALLSTTPAAHAGDNIPPELRPDLKRCIHLVQMTLNSLIALPESGILGGLNALQFYYVLGLFGAEHNRVERIFKKIPQEQHPSWYRDIRKFTYSPEFKPLQVAVAMSMTCDGQRMNAAEVHAAHICVERLRQLYAVAHAALRNRPASRSAVPAASDPQLLGGLPAQ
jgi:hypothetical protein